MDYYNLPWTLEHRVYRRLMECLHRDGIVSRDISDVIIEDEVANWYREQEEQYPGMLMFEE